MSSWPLLSLLIWLPILGGFAVLAAGPRLSRPLALIVSLLVLAVSIPLYMGYDASAAGAATMQFVERHVWIDAIDASYALGADGISVALIVLTAFVTVLVILGAWSSI